MSLSILILGIRKERLAMIFEFSRVINEIYLISKRLREKSQNIKNSQQALTTQYSPLIQSTGTSKSSTFFSCRLYVTFLEISQSCRIHGYDTTTRFYDGIINIVYNRPTNTIGPQI